MVEDEDSRRINEYLNHYVAVIDAKAAVLLATSLGSASFFLAERPVDEGPWFWVFLISLVLHTSSCAFAMSVIYPRLPSVGNSLIFWEDVQSRESVDHHLRDFREAREENRISEEWIKQNYFTSKVLHKKNFQLRFGLWLFGGGLLFAALLSFGSPIIAK